MQQQTLNFTAQPVDVRLTLAERVRVIHRVINTWLDSRSAFYSRVASMEVTRRTAIRVNLVTLAMIVAAVAVETQPVAALMAALATAWMMYRIQVGKGGKA